MATVTASGGTVQSYVYNAGTNTSTADVVVTITGLTGTLLSLDFSGTSGGVKNVKLMRPITAGSATSYAGNVIFTDYFLNNMASFKVLRSLGWSSVNWSPDSLWSHRTLWSHSHQSPNGIPGLVYGWEGRSASWEGFIMLANQLNKDIWITIPHKATDDYITKLAQLFKYGSDGTTPYTSTQANPIFAPLNANLKLYVEYSNEIWNYQFSQSGWITDKIRTYNGPINFDGETDLTTLTLRYKAQRSVEISNIFRTVNGNTDMMTKVRPVLCWQSAYNDLTNRTLSFVDRYYAKKDSRSPYSTPHEVGYYFYGGGGSGYWYSDGKTTLTNNSIWTNGGWDATKSYFDEFGNKAGYLDRAAVDAAWCKQYGMAYLNYEGDNHPTYQNNDEAIMAATHWDARMQQNTLDHLNVSAQVDCELFNFLSPGGSGSNNYWAVINYNNEGNLGSPQLTAIQQFNNATSPAINIGTMTPFTRPGRSYDTPERSTATGSENITANTDNNVSYLFRVPGNGTYNVKIDYSTTVSAKLEVQCAGTIIGTYNLTNTNGVSTLTTGANITCTAGKLYSIRVIALTGNININNIIVGNGAAARMANNTLIVNTTVVDAKYYSVFPNPAKDVLNVTLKDNSRATTSLFNASGIKVMEQTSNQKRVTLNVSKLQPGMYTLKITTLNGIIEKKVIVDK